MGGSKKNLVMNGCLKLSTFSTDAAGELDVLGHDGHTLGVDCAQVGVFEKTDQVRFAGFLQGHNGAALETKVGLEILSDLTDKSLEWQLADQKLSALLVTTDFAKSDGSWSVTMRLLYSAGGRCTLACNLGCQLLVRRFSFSVFTRGLLGTCHCILIIKIRKSGLKAPYYIIALQTLAKYNDSGLMNQPHVVLVEVSCKELFHYRVNRNSLFSKCRLARFF